MPRNSQTIAPERGRRSGLSDSCPAGLRVRDRGVDPELSQAVHRFAKWLRSQYCFPVRLVVYLIPVSQLRTRSGVLAYSAFFAPTAPPAVPHIRISAGDYRENKTRMGRINTIGMCLQSIARQNLCYQSWLRTGEFQLRNLPRDSMRVVTRYRLTEPEL